MEKTRLNDNKTCRGIKPRRPPLFLRRQKMRKNVTRISLAISGEKREIQTVQTFYLNRSKLIISRLCALLPSLRSTLKKGFPMPPQLRWRHQGWDCSGRVQSCRYTFDDALPFARGLADSIFLLPGVFVAPLQRHLKIPNGRDASKDAAINRGIIWIRLYSCYRQSGHYAGS
jgi:hypothetical protein